MKDKLWYCLIAIVLTSLLIQHYEYNAITKIFDNDTFEPQLRLHVTEEDTTNTTQQAEREVSQAAVVRKLKEQLEACQQKNTRTSNTTTTATRSVPTDVSCRR